MQTALAISILLVAPMRLRNLRELDLNRHFQRSRGRGGPVLLAIEPDEVKNRVALEFELPTEVAGLLDRYTEFRLPGLAPAKRTLLFPGEKGGSKHAVSLSDQIVKAIRRFTGLQMNVHLFRHLAAKLYLDHHPGAYATVSRLRCMPAAEWPARDSAAWTAIFRKGSILDGSGPGADWAPPTRTIPLRAGRYRDGLMLVLQSHRGLRLTNLTLIRIGKQLVPTSEGYWLRFEAKEMKARRPFEVPVPQELNACIDHYLTVWRPVLLKGGTTDALWLMQAGRPMRSYSVHSRMTKLTKRLFGKVMSTHLFRHGLGSHVAETDPEHVRIVTPLLSQKQFSTTDRYYIKAQQVTCSYRGLYRECCPHVIGMKGRCRDRKTQRSSMPRLSTRRSPVPQGPLPGSIY
jgi:integrase